MTVRQTGDRLEAESVLKGPQGEQKIPEMYVIDGPETDFKVSVGGGTGAGKRTAAWRDDRRGFDVTERAVVKRGGEDATITRTLRWTLAPDGRTLTVDVTMNGPQGEMKSVRVFSRKA